MPHFSRGNHGLRQYGRGLLVSAVILVLALGIGRAQPQRERPRTEVSANLLFNPSVAGEKGWTMAHGASYDRAVSHGPGTGSIRLPAPLAQVQSALVAVKPDMTYTFSAFMKSSAWPLLAMSMIGVYDAQGRFKYNLEGSYQATTEANVWQETVIIYRPRPGDAKVRVFFGRMERGKSPREDGIVWVDDFHFSEGVHFRRPPTAKKPFNGTTVRVDALGNFEVFRRGVWQPFFPFGVYQLPSKVAFDSYSQQGFNCIMFNHLGVDFVTKAQKAVSRFNPDGMMSMIELAQFLDPSTRFFNDLPVLRKGLAQLREAGVEGNILAYYWDNEQYNRYQEATKVIDIVRQSDVDKEGRRQHPIFMLQGNQGMTRAFHNLVDVVGDYLRNEHTNTYMRPQQATEDRFAILNNVEGQSMPVAMGIISEEETAAGVRRLVYEHLIAGGRGFAYFCDGAFFQYNGDRKSPAAKDMSLRQCWDEFPRLRTEIDRALPILRESHRTAWRVACSDPTLRIGTRTHDGEGYLIVLNTRRAAVQVALRVEGLPYVPSAVKDLFTDRVVAPVKEGEFRIALGEGGTALFRLAR